MANKLKHFRVIAGFTQMQIAKAVGVTQPTYQRWEAGSSEIPKDKLTQLSAFFGTDNTALLGQHAPMEAALYDDSAPDDLQIYGEVAIHFAGPGKSLLLTISEQVRSSIFSSIQADQKFIAIRDLGNRTVVVRRAAISDLYLSSEAYDDYGPEHHEPGYEHGTPHAVPDARDWEIIECLAHDADTSDFADPDVDRVANAIMITDEQYQDLIAKKCIAPEDLDAEKKNNERLTTQIFHMATHATYQFSSGLQRSVNVTFSNLYDAFSGLIEHGFDDETSVVLQTEGYHRAIFINLETVDYISIPSHLFDKSCIDVSAEMLDSSPNDDNVTLLRDRKSKGRPINDA
jgi:transcriptional regulator with XRE-family HTH domain